MIASTVSSKMLEKMAAVEGFKFVDCLTGFKYIGNTALALESKGFNVPFGYEEAIGFMFGDQIRDKDGVAASAVFAELAATLHSSGTDVKSYLDSLYSRYGFYQTSNGYFTCSDPAVTEAIFTRIRNFHEMGTAKKASYPSKIADMQVTRVVDLTLGYDSANAPTFKPSLPLSSGHMIQFRAESGDASKKIVLTIRTSGTEPKIKYYLEATGGDTEEIMKLLPVVVDDLAETWMEASRYKLGRS